MIVLDTSALVFWTLDPERLSKTAEQAIEEVDRVGISSISIWEIGVKVKTNGLDLPLSLREFAEYLGRTDQVELLHVDVKVWVGNLALDWDHWDPADRAIVATAEMRNCPLITSDATILDFYSRAIWWGQQVGFVPYRPVT